MSHLFLLFLGLLFAVLKDMGAQKTCAKGHITDNDQCVDINECTTNKVICGSDATCHNAPGSYYCTCVSGFVASNGQQQFTASQNVTCNGET
ncbi:adhesion G protein-coupled receptor E2-like isoform X2 [Clarias gariepinus]|uniref:adhesion G protein-coupled receptor E2-like isoform X2 n=1 Tax=Clarias gariepinus TaxID=13013 RepID=UPI00234CD5EB|nr:adhesion G protein-coupled receptor E2-like isoform X2 [Clarias gariepinus]